MKRTHYYSLFTRVDILCERDGGEIVHWDDWHNDALFVKRDSEEFELEGLLAVFPSRILDFGRMGTSLTTIVPKGEVFETDVHSGLPYQMKRPPFSPKRLWNVSRLLKVDTQWLGLKVGFLSLVLLPLLMPTVRTGESE
jgi:hypothetical protein